MAQGADDVQCQHAVIVPRTARAVAAYSRAGAIVSTPQPCGGGIH
jgi:hypothetical protein